MDFKVAKEFKLKTYSYSPLAHGILSGKYNQNSYFSNKDRRHRLPLFAKNNWENNYKVLETLLIISKEYGKSISQIAIKWIIQKGLVDEVILGVKNMEQFITNFKSLELELDLESMKKIDNASKIFFKNLIL